MYFEASTAAMMNFMRTLNGATIAKSSAFPGLSTGKNHAPNEAAAEFSQPNDFPNQYTEATLDPSSPPAHFQDTLQS
jgi:hypothetical protein